MVGQRIVKVHFVAPVSWWFELAEGGTLRVDTVWRVVAGKRVEATSADHGQLFGRQHPVDSAVRAADVLADATVRQALIIEETGDVVLDFDNGSRLEILTTSSGYEGWAIVSPRGDEVVGLGGGPVEVRRHDS